MEINEAKTPRQNAQGNRHKGICMHKKAGRFFFGKLEGAREKC